MGQSSSGDRVAEWAEVHRRALNLKELAMLTYESFKASLNKLNDISRTFPDSNGKTLHFAVQSGTDTSLLWKATVRIYCFRVDVTTNKVASYRLLNLKQYMMIHRLLCQLGSDNKPHRSRSVSTPGKGACCKEDEYECGASSNSDASSESQSCKGRNAHIGTLANTTLTTSMILEEVSSDPDQPMPLEECCICMERKPELILPCAHSYCAPCIEQWNVSSKTCPVCRETLESTDDSWVISEAPESSEVEAELRKILSGLVKDIF